MKWVDEILVEAARVFVQAAQITLRLFEYAALAVKIRAQAQGCGPGGRQGVSLCR